MASPSSGSLHRRASLANLELPALMMLQKLHAEAAAAGAGEEDSKTGEVQDHASKLETPSPISLAQHQLVVEALRLKAKTENAFEQVDSRDSRSGGGAGAGAGAGGSSALTRGAVSLRADTNKPKSASPKAVNRLMRAANGGDFSKDGIEGLVARAQERRKALADIDRRNNVGYNVTANNSKK